MVVKDAGLGEKLEDDQNQLSEQKKSEVCAIWSTEDP
jgi:hypothetical protein